MENFESETKITFKTKAMNRPLNADTKGSVTSRNFANPRSLISNTKSCRRGLSRTKAPPYTHRAAWFRRYDGFIRSRDRPRNCTSRDRTTTARHSQHDGPPFAPLFPHTVSPTLQPSTSLCFALAPVEATASKSEVTDLWRPLIRERFAR
ncbi:hypothetical protein EUGRSUZ_D01631 [Eucalyptus grandis]|uniref:Uncharacterized protein n=2 Tax=Eucalyptus grandis TaxID=71139 RepID=A0ACC3KWP8_EUCGR|nr:hypothetical protein EUGRSUZ_D01631 [Eucalyptus grandis]